MKKLVFVILGLTLFGCKKGAEEDFSIKPVSEKSELVKKAENFFKSISTVKYEAIPLDKIDLGKKLYFDKTFSKNGDISCNSCHNLATFGVDNKVFSLGDSKQPEERNSPSVIYASLHASQFWDGRGKAIGETGNSNSNPVEHGIPSAAVLVKKLNANPEYQAAFKKAFPNDKEPITIANFNNAIEAFERQLLPKSKFDSYLDGDEDALSEQEKKGLSAFIDNACITCHSGVAVGGQLMQKFGLYGDYANLTHSKKTDKGLYNVTKKEGDQFLFKTPSLRNSEKTYPYFHDGSVASLKEAIKIMGKLQLKKDISDADANDMEAFLKTLTADVDSKYKE
ncbi:cytochrome c peroxidase [Flavobacterium fluvii]|uniref:Cytochrome c peroxidase n=1 Tax=Flavobacterium fluvii TaxID=468056 RepID=A0A1M5EIQ6_9FLAO|nr:cytochrome c peroxidase [Flavobacterium fluvii]SHF78942.1 cytochrome c peroxidase [Flavobacterium fluvii]